jgi:hypothetical protein
VLMALGIDHHVHFRCMFTLIPEHGSIAKWGDISYAIRRWIAKRAEKNEGFQGKWFFVGGQWKPAGNSRLLVQTIRSVGDGGDDCPQFWAIRYEHADDDTFARQWRTDIGLTLHQNRAITVSLSTIHWLLPGFIGKEPEPPLPTAPAIVGMLLKMPNWIAQAGSERLVQVARAVNEGYADVFRDRLIDPERKVPIVLVTKNFSSGKPMLDSNRLARLLAGTAGVYEAETSLVDKELEYLLDPEYRCWNGRVRVYQTGLNPERYGDSKRHRYFTADDISSMGDSTVLEILVRGIVRRSQIQLGGAITSIDDVQARIQEQHLAELRASAPNTEAWVKALEADNKRLADELAGSRKDVESWYGEAERLQSVDEDNRILEFRNEALSRETAEAKERADALEAQANVLLNVNEFPEAVSDVIGLVEQAFPGRLLFTDRAKKDAVRCKLRDVSAAWRCLKAMATHLHRLHFVEHLPMREVAKQFQSLVPFELATTESETTKNNKRLAKQRKAVYKGQERDFSPHVKFGRDPGNSLRVHYFVDAEDRLIVIDRCGDHLDLKSTN